MNVAWNEIREHNEKGKLVGAGFVWREKIAERYQIQEYLICWPLGWVFLTGPFFLYYMTHTIPARMDFISFVVLASCPFAVFVMALQITPPVLNRLSQTAGVLFTEPGGIAIILRPRLLSSPKSQEWANLRQSVEDIASIEMRTAMNVGGRHYRFELAGHSYFAYSVWLYFLNGQAVVVGESLSEEEARIVTYQLNDALREIRPSIVRIPGPSSYRDLLLAR